MLWIISAAIAAWLAFCLVFARLGGWLRVAESYRATNLPSGDWDWFSAHRLGEDGKGGFALAGLLPTQEGLYLRSIPLLRPFRPPLLVPWQQIGYNEISSRLILDRSLHLLIADTTGLALKPFLDRAHGPAIAGYQGPLDR